MGGDSSAPRRALCSFQAWGLLSLVLVVAVLSFFDFEAFAGRVGQVRLARTNLSSSQCIRRYLLLCECVVLPKVGEKRRQCAFDHLGDSYRRLNQ